MSQPDALPLEGTVVAVAADGGHRFNKPTRDRIVLLEGHGVEGTHTQVHLSDTVIWPAAGPAYPISDRST